MGILPSGRNTRYHTGTGSVGVISCDMTTKVRAPSGWLGLCFGGRGFDMSAALGTFSGVP